MPHDISRITERICLGSTAPPEELTPAKSEERELLKAQILSVGFDLNDDPAVLKWNNTELQELFDAIVAAQDGTLFGEQEWEEPKEEIGRILRVKKHKRGVNDLMSGALPPRRPSEPKNSAPEEFDDPTVSIDTLPRLYRSMPHYMISVKILRTLNLFTNPVIYELLASDFFTTVKGLKRAWDEANAQQLDATDDMDEYLFEAVLKRGGLVENAYWSVKYPCDIVAQNGEEADPEFWKEIREMDWSVGERMEREARESRRFRR
jgi:hypothetical protein